MSTYDNVVLFIVLLLTHYLSEDDSGKTDLICRRYEIMVVTVLKNWSKRYSYHFIIKFVDLILIYYAINMDIVLSYMNFSNLHFRSTDLL